MATGILHLGVYLGFGLSQAAGIYITNLNILDYGWRVPYFLTAAPGIILSLLLMILTDPRQSESSSEDQEESQSSKEKLLSVRSDQDEDEKRSLSGDLMCLMRSVSTMFMMLMFLAAASRHSAGFTWAYNCRLYFLTYYPQLHDVGSYFSVSAIVGGATGVIIGGRVADRLSSDASSSQYKKTRIKLTILGSAMLLSSPFAFSVLMLDPPFAFISLFFYYLTGWYKDYYFLFKLLIYLVQLRRGSVFCSSPLLMSLRSI